MTDRSELVINKQQFFICKYRRKYLQKQQQSHKYSDIINIGTLQGTSHKATTNTIGKNRLHSICQFDCDLFGCFAAKMCIKEHVAIYLKRKRAKNGRMPEIWFEGCVVHQLFMHLSTALQCCSPLCCPPFIYASVHCWTALMCIEMNWSVAEGVA